MINNKKSDLQMYKPTAILRPEDIEPPLYEVRMKNAVRRNKRNIIS